MGRHQEPKDMCPECHRRGVEFVPWGQRPDGKPFLTYRCPSCGHRMTQGQRLHITPEERRARARECSRRYREEHAERERKRRSDYKKAHRADINLKRRLRYRSDEAYREEQKRRSRGYYAAHREERDAYMARWRAEHPGETYVISKRAALRMDERRKRNGNG